MKDEDVIVSDSHSNRHKLASPNFLFLFISIFYSHWVCKNSRFFARPGYFRIVFAFYSTHFLFFFIFILDRDCMIVPSTKQHLRDGGGGTTRVKEVIWDEVMQFI